MLKNLSKKLISLLTALALCFFLSLSVYTAEPVNDVPYVPEGVAEVEPSNQDANPQEPDVAPFSLEPFPDEYEGSN